MPVPDASLKPFRPGARLAAGFCLDSAIATTRAFDQDLVTCVVVLGMVAANVAADRRAFAGPQPDTTPFAALNRAPVSVYRLARNLGLPYETARRHTARLVKLGVCVREDAGLTIAPEALFRAAASDVTQEVWHAAVGVHADLRALGLHVPDYPADVSSDEQRRVARLANTFFLASLRIVVEATASDLISALIFLGVHRANRAGLKASDANISGSGRPDDQRTPVSVYKLAKVLRLPYETTRRHAAILVSEGLCERNDAGGLIVPAAVLDAPGMVAALTEAWGLLVDFITAAFGPVPELTATA